MPARKHERTWPALATGAVLSTLTASTVLVLDGLRVLRSESAPVLADAAELDRPRPDRAPDARELAAQVLARNMFDSPTGPLAWQEPIEHHAGMEADPLAASEPPQPCEGDPLRLIASVVNSVHPEHSFAALRMDGKTHILGIGGQLGEVTLLALRPAYAYVRRGATQACVLPVFLPASQRPELQPAPVAQAPAAAAKPKGRALFSAQELDAGVRALGGGRYAVSKALLTRALRSPTGAPLGARLRPVERYGRTIGWELTRLRKDSALARMGLQKGDLLRSVNGHELSDASALLVALRMLQQTDSVTLAILRGNVAQHLQYTLD